MMKNRLPLIAFLLAGLAGAGSTVQADILVGTAGPLSGPNAALGEQLKRGAQQAIDDINATGGIRGERLVLVAGDDACDPKKAVEVATDFVSKGVKFVAGHYCSGASIPAAKVYEAAGIVQLSPASTNPKFTDDGGWNVLRTAPRDDAQGTFAAKRIATSFAGKKIAVLNDKSPAGMALAASARQYLEQAGVPITVDGAYTTGAKDYLDLAQTLRDAAIDVVYLGGTYAEAGLIIRQLRGLGSQAQLISGDSLVSEEFWTIARDSGEGALMTFALDPQTLESAKPVIRRFTDFDYIPEGYTLNAYAAVQAWVHAAEATGSTDSARIAQWLRSGSPVSTVLGEISFNAKGDLTDPQFAWFRWSKGKYTEDTFTP